VTETSTEDWIAGDWVESESRGTIGLTLHAPFGGYTDTLRRIRTANGETPVSIYHFYDDSLRELLIPGEEADRCYCSFRFFTGFERAMGLYHLQLIGNAWHCQPMRSRSAYGVLPSGC
jgi:hypothetical protein